MAALDRFVSRDLLITAAIACCGGAVWFGVSTVEHQLHMALAGGALTGAILLSSGIRILFLLVMGGPGALALAVAALLLGLSGASVLGPSLLINVAGFALVPYLALGWVERRHRLGPLLSGLSTAQLLTFAAIDSAVIGAAAAAATLTGTEAAAPLVAATGNLLGILAVFSMAFVVVRAVKA